MNLKDVLKQAQARFMNAQADMYDRQNSITGTGTAGSGKLYGLKSLPEKSSYNNVNGEKKLQRPVPWPELDKVEREYEDRLKADWTKIKEKILIILKLSDLAGQQSAKDESIGSVDVFAFTEEQRAAIMQAMKDFIGIYNPDDPDSPIRWYYGQSYSLGLIQAANMIGETHPALDIIKNREIYDELCMSGFELLKNDATRMIVKDILPEMQAQMIAGTNPRHVAARLEGIFDAQNSDWERLARTEMTIAAEKAKLDEWKEWKVKAVEFTPAPDACAVCLTMAGEYPINKCPVPGRDTHPRCRCSIRVGKGEV